MRPPADLKKRLDALEKHFAARLTATLWITDNIASWNWNGAPFQIERGPEEGLDDFQARAIAAAKARCPRVTLLILPNLTEDELRL